MLHLPDGSVVVQGRRIYNQWKNKDDVANASGKRPREQEVLDVLDENKELETKEEENFDDAFYDKHLKKVHKRMKKQEEKAGNKFNAVGFYIVCSAC